MRSRYDTHDHELFSVQGSVPWIIAFVLGSGSTNEECLRIMIARMNDQKNELKGVEPIS